MKSALTRVIASEIACLRSRARGVAVLDTRTSSHAASVGPLGLHHRLELLERLADQPRDVHLRDAEDRADLSLLEVLLEAQPQDLAVARRQVPEIVVDQDRVLCRAERLVLTAEQLAQRRGL